MKHLFRAKDKFGNTIYGDVVYGRPIDVYGEDNYKNYEYMFVTSVLYEERWEVEFDDGYPRDEYYPDWDVETTDICWNTLEFNLNGKWIEYEVNQ